MTLLVAAIIVGVCIVMEAFFSGSEIALISADKHKLQARAQSGGRRSRIIARFLERPDHLITTSLVGTNFCVVIASIVSTLWMLNWRPQQAELYSLAVVSPLVLIFGEIVPKSIFHQYADRLAPKAVVALWIFYRLFSPLVLLAGKINDLALRWLKLDHDKPPVTREELALLIQMPHAHGEIAESERAMIGNIFETHDRTVEEVMLPLSEVSAIDAAATISQAVNEANDKRYTRLPVYQERVDRIVGVVHVFDLLKARSAMRGAEPVGNLARPPIFTPEKRPALELLVELQRKRQGMAIVVDEYGGAVGIVTIEDILEEIVGAIEDEYDEMPRIRQTAPGVFLLSARASIEAVNRQTKAELPEGDYETVAGLVLEKLRRIPEQGETVKVGAATLVVTRATERSVEEVQLRLGRTSKR